MIGKTCFDSQFKDIVHPDREGWVVGWLHVVAVCVGGGLFASCFAHQAEGTNHFQASQGMTANIQFSMAGGI